MVCQYRDFPQNYAGIPLAVTISYLFCNLDPYSFLKLINFFNTLVSRVNSREVLLLTLASIYIAIYFHDILQK